MDRITTYATNAIVTSAQLNELQDNVFGGVKATEGTVLESANAGARTLWYQSDTDIPDATILTIDVRNWSDFVVSWQMLLASGGSQDIGAANDYVFDSGTVTSGVGYLGLGAKDGGAVQVTAGNPPVRAAGSSWAADLGGGMWLYVDAFDSNKLKLYNNTGGAKRTPFLLLVATKTNKR